MQFSAIHLTQAFIQLEQGPDEPLNMYLHNASEPLSKICHTSNMSRTPVTDINHYTVVYSPNSRRLKDSVVGHRSTPWKMMEEYFRDIWNLDINNETARLLQSQIQHPSNIDN